MKKELFAAALLAVILALSLWNTSEISALSGELSELVEESGRASAAGDWEGAQAAAERAMELWHSRQGYTHTVLRHTDIETLSDDFFELLEHINTADPGAVQSAVRLVREHLQGIADMESINLGSIF